MIDIKFRILDEHFNKYIYFDLTNVPEDSGHMSIEYVQIRAEQYTGLKDKNGREIYEGDKLVWLSSDNEEIDKVFVDFEGGCYWFGDQAVIDRKIDEYEIIGNIHEETKC